MASVQVYGIDKIMEWAANLDCPAWAIFDGKRMIAKYEGNDQNESVDLLRKILEAFHETTIATYTLKFFEQPDSGKLKIKEKSECDAGSFNFKLSENEEQYLSRRQSMGFAPAKLDERIENRLAAIEDKITFEDDGPPSFIEQLQNPDTVKEWLGVIGMLKNIFSNNPSAQLAAIGSATRISNEPTVNKEYTGQDQERLISAINILQAADPDILIHLEKLAKMSQDNKAMFDNLIYMLNAT